MSSVADEQTSFAIMQRRYVNSCLVSLLASGMMVGLPAQAKVFHVSPRGDDSGPGTEAVPFASPARALEAVRGFRAGGLKEEVRVVFRGGTYELAAPLVFTPLDSGTADHPITYAAQPGETVILSGGRRVIKWTTAAAGHWAATVPEAKAGGRSFRQFYINDRRATRARWPDADGQLRIASVGNEVKTFTFSKPLPQGTAPGLDMELVVYENWAVSRALVTSVDGNRLTTATPVGWLGHGDMTTASVEKPVFLEHARAFLDQPGEWFLDRASGVLSYS
jgi:hypothetical protein